jgi:hypothetical protein
MDERYWPFDVLPPEERTPQHQAEVGFLEAAYREEFRPYTFGAGSYGATAGERGGLIIVRTRSFWELRVGDAECLALFAYIGPFEVAAEAALMWLRGGPVSRILKFIRPHLD